MNIKGMGELSGGMLVAGDETNRRGVIYIKRKKIGREEERKDNLRRKNSYKYFFANR